MFYTKHTPIPIIKLWSTNVVLLFVVNDIFVKIYINLASAFATDI
jgi:hypothetical protein